MTQTVQVVKKTLALVRSDKRHRVIVGGRGKGASWSIARILLMRGMRDKRFVACVREVQKTIKYSVKKLLDDTIDELGWGWFYQSTQSEILGKNGTRFAFFGMQEYNADNVKSLEGADDCWVAEAQTLSRRSINVLRPTIRKEGSVIWWDFNPRYETDPVYVDYVLNSDPNAEVLRLNWRDNPWFTAALKQELESDYLRDEAEARHIWEGELRAMGDLFVCPSELVDLARANEITRPSGVVRVGADIAHQGGDLIVFYKRWGRKVVDEYVSRYQDTPTTVAHLKAFAGDKSVAVTIDNGDIGKAVADFMELDGWSMNRVNFGGKAFDTEHYDDCATEMYFDLRDQLAEIDIPKDDELRSQLVQRKYQHVGGKRGYEVVRIESKADFVRHAAMQSASPDKADALVLCFYEPGGGGSIAATLNVM